MKSISSLILSAGAALMLATFPQASVSPATAQTVSPCANVQCGDGRIPVPLGDICLCLPDRLLTGTRPSITLPGDGADALKCRVPCPSGYRHGPTCDCRPEPAISNAAAGLLQMRLKGLRKRLGLQTTGGGLEYTCESTSNKCTCNNSDPLDCIDLIADGECKGVLTGPDGKICVGQSGNCTCTWH